MSSVTEIEIFTDEELSRLDAKGVPQHVAFIPDGNRRWARKNGKDRLKGHQQGADILLDIIKGCKTIGIKTATFFLFSTENWTRSRTEIQGLMWILRRYLIDQRQELLDNGIRLHAIGDTTKLPRRVQKALQETIEATKECREIDVIFALNYGGRDEIRRTFTRMAKEIQAGNLQPEAITEETVGRYLDTADWRDPDLLIRTSGEMRLSNFLLWQISYTEVYISESLWPEFTPKNLLEAVLEYQKRERRRGV